MTSQSSPPGGTNNGIQRNNDRSAVSPIRRPRTRSPATARRLQTKNRRRRYLELHPEYYDSPSLELADPLTYDRLIRLFQSTAEREKEGRKKGYAGILEADLWRQEAKSAAQLIEADGGDARVSRSVEVDEENAEHDIEEEEPPEDKEQGFTRWRAKVEQRFMEGNDPDFEYEFVDCREEYDDRALEDREEEERWFDDEEAAWIQDRQKDEVGAVPEETGQQSLSGQTGIQDF